MISVVRKWFAPLLLQALVDGLHVIDSMAIIVVQISLTYFLKSVDSHSFFDISNVFPVGGEPGAQASAKLIKDRTLLGFARNWIGKAGRQGSIANCWSRRMGQSTQTRGFLIFSIPTVQTSSLTCLLKRTIG